MKQSVRVIGYPPTDYDFPAADYDRSPRSLSQDEYIAALGIDDRLVPVVDAKFWHGVKVALVLTACIAAMGWFAAYRIFWS